MHSPSTGPSREIPLSAWRVAIFIATAMTEYAYRSAREYPRDAFSTLARDR